MTIRRIGHLLVLSWIMISACKTGPSSITITHQELANHILADASLQTVERMARELLGKGFEAGGGYTQVWIRDMNTFIETSCEVYDQKEIRRHLLTFYYLQQKNGEIVDGFVPKGISDHHAVNHYTSSADSQHEGFKNTVKTDQETSLIQAVGKYIRKTGDRSILDAVVDHKTVRSRMAWSIGYILQNRYSPRYGLITGATTQDWGDVQPEDSPGVLVNEKTHWSCEIYNNAMFILALDTMIEFSATPGEKQKWMQLKDRISHNIRKHLWESRRHKFLPHLYLNGSPFPANFDESTMYFHGGTAVAIEAGLLSKDEIAVVNRQMLENVRLSGAASIGLTIYPPYPKGFFKNLKTSVPYTYQNGGDWTWFGGRMIQQLVSNGFVQEAYDEIRPMTNRVLTNKGFYEWYTRKRFTIEIKQDGVRWYGAGGKPDGSNDFRGEAGVLAKAIRLLREWAIKETRQRKLQVLLMVQPDSVSGS